MRCSQPRQIFEGFLGMQEAIFEKLEVPLETAVQKHCIENS